MTETATDIVTFVVTDIEADGPSPLESSMLSFASVACAVRVECSGVGARVSAPPPGDVVSAM